MRTIPNMVNTGPDIIAFNGTRRSFWRNVYRDGERFYCIWYGEIIEVVKATGCGYRTVDEFDI